VRFDATVCVCVIKNSEKFGVVMTMYCRKGRTMLSLNILLFSFMFVSIMLALFMAWKNHQRFKENVRVSGELDTILHGAIKTLEKKRAAATRSHQLHKNYTENDLEDINSPEMLSTLLTVMVHKYGMATLSLADFKNISNDDFVSIYVDTKTNELILSLNQNLQDIDTMGLSALNPNTDDTFH